MHPHTLLSKSMFCYFYSISAQPLRASQDASNIYQDISKQNNLENVESWTQHLTKETNQMQFGIYITDYILLVKPQFKALFRSGKTVWGIGNNLWWCRPNRSRQEEVQHVLMSCKTILARIRGHNQFGNVVHRSFLNVLIQFIYKLSIYVSQNLTPLR